MENSVAGVAKSYNPVPTQFMSSNSKQDSCSLPPSYRSSSRPFPAALRVDQSWSSNGDRKQKMMKKVDCGKGASVSFPENQQLQIQFGDDETITEEELMSLGKLGDKCKEVSGGIAELLECLECEAIMGDDEGKAATDYNRRAQIFDTSSRVFQALKQNPTPSVD